MVRNEAREMKQRSDHVKELKFYPIAGRSLEEFFLLHILFFYESFSYNLYTMKGLPGWG